MSADAKEMKGRWPNVPALGSCASLFEFLGKSTAETTVIWASIGEYRDWLDHVASS